MPVYTQRPRCSTKEPNRRGSTAPMRKAGSRVSRAVCTWYLRGFQAAPTTGNLLRPDPPQAGLRHRELGRLELLDGPFERGTGALLRVAYGSGHHVAERREVVAAEGVLAQP